MAEIIGNVLKANRKHLLGVDAQSRGAKATQCPQATG
jgi:hypothetical protein